MSSDKLYAPRLAALLLDLFFLHFGNVDFMGHGLNGARLFNELVRCSQEDLHKLREDCNVTWMMHLSKTNQEQYGHRNTQAKTTAFLFEMCLLAGIYMHKNPPYILLFIICALQRGCVHITSICSP